VPTNSIMARGLALTTTEETLVAQLAQWGPSSVRLIKDQKGGESRGFAFIEFGAPETAQWFLDQFPDGLLVDGRRVSLGFSRNKPKGNGGRALDQGVEERKRADWICEGCEYVNFARRGQCFQCSAPRSSGAVLVKGDDNVGGRAGTYSGGSPNSVLVVRALNTRTTEETIKYSFRSLGAVSDVRLVRDRQSGESRGFAFVEFTSTAEAARAMQASVGLIIDDAYVRVAFSRDVPGSAEGGPVREPSRPPNIAPVRLVAFAFFLLCPEPRSCDAQKCCQMSNARRAASCAFVKHRAT